jgi:beta-lactamase regulating signal transducer with metallopeptidase domain
MIVASLAWALLRLIGRQSSKTRFAVWFGTLLTIVALPFFATLGAAVQLPMIASAKVHQEIVLSASWADYLFAAWAFGATFLLLRLGVGLWQVHGLRSSCREVELERLEPAMAQVFRDFAARSQTTLCVSEHVNVPSAIGFLRPAIVFPAWLLPQLSADEIAVILLHEHAHLRRWDQWTNLAQKFARAVFFFHPAVWWIENHLTLEREMACDDIVLAQSQSPKAYASFLVAFAEKLQHTHGPELVQALVSRMRQMSMRVTQILDGKRSRRTGLWAPVLAVNTMLVALVFGAAPYVPRLVGFRTQPGRSQSRHMLATSRAGQAGNRQAESDGARIAAARTTAAFPMTRPVSQRSNFALQPRAIPAFYHPHAAALPLRLKAPSAATTPATTQAIAPAQPAVIRTKAETNAPPRQATYVVVETTQYNDTGDRVWTLCIWRVKGGKRQLETAIAQII